MHFGPLFMQEFIAVLAVIKVKLRLWIKSERYTTTGRLTKLHDSDLPCWHILNENVR